ncbi:acyl-CoA thioesterase [Moellerella wisconsensis]|uniref:Acyl-CoA thioesterase n=2 Tax=Moellerella wisconsensis TaxID=158849 RepID=A0ACD3Y6M9_9GAMM|nr:thioesterase family protein [Moellerella wisconsensis]UNH26766.1 acyl-CoA thioesterase [Moellerella wisconsensis]UNH30250.1 acyl-CoA thioesterase [Moellerella wisconsensis]UNH38409.1 acyl-CoA thioesterase [Moellerella wisconsensis]UNH41925.1 acyl-CoA thioesterase [Moellerella wisconsensis]
MASQIKVIGYHIDVFGHVNNARYLEFYEMDRWAWLDKNQLKEWMMLNKMAMVAVNINVNYRIGAVLGDQLTISSSIQKIGEKSAVCYQQITRERNQTKELVSDATITFVFIDLITNKALPITDKLRQILDVNDEN